MFTKFFMVAGLVFAASSSAFAGIGTFADVGGLSSRDADLSSTYNAPMPNNGNPHSEESSDDMALDADDICSLNDEGTRFTCRREFVPEGAPKFYGEYGGTYSCSFKIELDFFSCWREGFRLMADIERLLETGKASGKLDAIIALDLMDENALAFMAKRFDGEAEEKRIMFFKTYFTLKDKVNGTRVYLDFNEMQRAFGLYN